LGGETSGNSVAQTISTVAGQAYRLEFDWDRSTGGAPTGRCRSGARRQSCSIPRASRAHGCSITPSSTSSVTGATDCRDGKPRSAGRRQHARPLVVGAGGWGSGAPASDAV